MTMKRIILILFLTASAVLLCAVPPSVENVFTAQRTDGSKIVDVYYDLVDLDGDLCEITVILSTDGGSIFDIFPSPEFLSGDVGLDIAPGPGKHIEWQAGNEGYLLDDDQYVFQIWAEDHTITPPAEFTFVDGGMFFNGTSNVSVSGFQIGIHEVTQAQFEAVMGYNPVLNYPPPQWPDYGTGPDFPVYYVSWFDAIAYCNIRSMQEGLIPCYSYGISGTDPGVWPDGWNSYYGNHTQVSCNWNAEGYRLPTEMEWQFAASGGNFSMGFTYSGSNAINDVGWYAGNSGLLAHPVMQLMPNEIATFDMSGNVREWCWDIYGPYTPVPPFFDPVSDPDGALTGNFRVNRGGYFQDPAGICAVNYRMWAYADLHEPDQGFRLVKAMPQPEFIWVEGGTFNNSFGDVTLSSFQLGMHELTQKQYVATMHANPAYTWAPPYWYGLGSYHPEYYISWMDAVAYCNMRSYDENMMPCYSYVDSQGYDWGTNPDNWPDGWNNNYPQPTHDLKIVCNWLASGYRLPTEMQWQFAAMGGNLSQGYVYSGSNDLGTVGWWQGNSGNSTHPVMQKIPNELGFFDMSGNCREWCWDLYGALPTTPQTDPTGPTTGTQRIHRGGWANDGAGWCTVLFRSYNLSNFHEPDMSVRIIRPMF